MGRQHDADLAMDALHMAVTAGLKDVEKLNNSQARKGSFLILFVLEIRADLFPPHFEDRFENRTMSFDYRLRPGVVEHSNALALMRAVGMEVRLKGSQITRGDADRCSCPKTMLQFEP